MDSGRTPSATVKPDGTAIVVWAQGSAIKTAVRSPGKPWSGPRTLFRSSSQWGPDGPKIATDGRGNLVVVWSQGSRVWAMSRPNGEPWSPRVRIASMPRKQQVVSELHLAVGLDGTALVSFWRGRNHFPNWAFDDSTVNNMRGIAVIRPAGGRWGASHTFAGPRDQVHGWCNPALGAGYFCWVWPPTGVVYDDGGAMVGWSPPGYMESGPAIVRAKPPHGQWGSRVRLTPKGRKTVGAPRLAATSWGQVTAAWDSGHGIRSRTKSAGGSWGAIQRVAKRGELDGLGVDGAGTATILYSTFRHAYTKTRPRSGSWVARTAIGRGGVALAVNSTGEAVAALGWGATRASWRNSSAPWPPATRIGAGSGFLTAAIGEDDTAVVAWFRGAGQNRQVLKATVHPAR